MGDRAEGLVRENRVDELVVGPDVDPDVSGRRVQRGEPEDEREADDLEEQQAGVEVAIVHEDDLADNERPDDARQSEEAVRSRPLNDGQQHEPGEPDQDDTRERHRHRRRQGRKRPGVIPLIQGEEIQRTRGAEDYWNGVEVNLRREKPQRKQHRREQDAADRRDGVEAQRSQFRQRTIRHA